MEFVKSACEDAYDRLIFPSLEREIRSTLTERANEGAIGQFALNLKPLLMQPPVKGKVTMGLDPGYRMGCKVAVVDGTGKVLDTAVVYPTYGQRQKDEAIAALTEAHPKAWRGAHRHRQRHRQPGNGADGGGADPAGGRSGANVSYMIVCEAGASVYSASKLAAEEFPQFDVNLRSAVSIARRLQDPLAELVKIDPKAIGVGQYQHDMPPKQLDEALGRRGGGLRQRRGRGREHRLALPAAAGGGTQRHHGEKRGGLPGGKRPLHLPRTDLKGAQAGAQGLRAVRGLSAGAGEQERAGQHRRPPGELRRGRRRCWTLCGYTLEDVEAGRHRRPAGAGATRYGEAEGRRGRAAWACPPCGTLWRSC